MQLSPCRGSGTSYQKVVRCRWADEDGRLCLWELKSHEISMREEADMIATVSYFVLSNLYSPSLNWAFFCIKKILLNKEDLFFWVMYNVLRLDIK